MHDMRHGYQRALRLVREHGAHTAPRGLGTRQLTGFHAVLTNPRDSLPLGVGRGLNPSIAAVEAAQLIAGETWPDLVVAVAPAFAEFADDGAFHGAYGPRVGHQYDYVVEELTMDPDSRRAQITLWDPLKDTTRGYHDYPCTTAIQFIRQGGRLECHAHMRSNDVWRGFAYDVFQFTQLQLSVAAAAGLEAGNYHHYAVSMHLYDTDVEAADRCLARQPEEPVSGLPAGLDRGTARRLLMEASRGTGGDWPDGSDAQWYRERLARRSTRTG